MVNFPVRNSRRRRVLNDRRPAATAISSGSIAATVYPSKDDEVEPAPRYSEAASVEHHPQITDFVPRRYRSIFMLIVIGVVSSTALSGLDYLAPICASAFGVTAFPSLAMTVGENMGRWVAAVVLLVTSVLCLIICSLRRHRIDDFRGRYRVWLAASAVCLALSANSVAALHQVVAQVLVGLTNWTALRDGAAWWLLVFGVPVTWVAARTLLDVRECRLAAALLAGAIGFYAGSAVSYLRLAPELEPSMNVAMHVPVMLTGHWVLLASVAAYARFVVLDVQGLIPVRRSSRKPRPQGEDHRDKKEIAAKPTNLPGIAAFSGTRSNTMSTTVKEVAWIDGSRTEHDHYEDECHDESSDAAHKLNKSERKRLRKLKAQRRAA